MSDYRVVAHRSEEELEQPFYVTIVAANGEVLFTSELYRGKDHAVGMGQKVAAALDGNFVNEAGGPNGFPPLEEEEEVEGETPA